MTSHESNEQDMNIVLASLKDIAEAVMHAAEAGTLEQVLERIAQVTQQVVHARYAALGVPDGRGSLRYFKVVGVSDDQIEHIGHYPVGLGLLGAIMHERQTIRLPRMKDDSRSIGFPQHHPVMTSLLGVPIQLGSQLFGMLYLCDRVDGEPFSEQDEWLVETLAGYAALAIAGVQLSEQNGRVVLLEERERVARELHDGIIQSLYAIGMQLQLIRLAQTGPDGEMGEIIHSLDTVIEDIRRYILNLRVANYEQQTMSEALKDIVARLHIPETMTVEVDAPNRQPPFASPVFESVCQIAQEALSNTVRHADARHVKLSIRESDETFEMLVEDDGKGFDLNDSDRHEGLGLRNMQQRARILGGSVQIRSTPGEGTRLTVRLPVST
jgi:signal transduction histidine kinase